MSKIEPIINCQNVSFGYENDLVFEDVSFQILPGDYVGLLGKNGSGKTTLVRILLGLLSPKNGNVHLFGESLRNFSQWERIGYVPQHVYKNENSFPATVREVVESGHSKASQKRCLLLNNHCLTSESILEKLGITHLSKRRIGELSAGEKQRVFIARALISQPEILFLDEPTTGIDAKAEADFYALLDTLHEEGITIVLISHDIEMVAKKTNKILCLEKRGTTLVPAGVFSPEKYALSHGDLRHIHHNHS